MRVVTRTNLILFGVYVVVMASSLVMFHVARNWAIDEFGTENAQRDWTVWRNKSDEQSKGTGPVERRKARSPQPPTLVLLRDYDVTCQTAIILFGSTLFFALVLFIRGVFARSSFHVVESDEDADATGSSRREQDSIMSD